MNFRKNILEVTKFRMVPMVWITAAFGYFLAHPNPVNWQVLGASLFFMAFVSGGASALNNYLDRSRDALMHRTKNRVLPAQIFSEKFVLLLGIALVLLGTLGLFIFVNALCALLMLIAAVLYVLVYTPLKRITWWNTFVGAFPGAIPPLAGWVTATGRLDVEAWVLFGILFCWQFPHFFAIATIHRDDYERGGFKMLPLFDPTNDKTAKQILFYTILLIVVSVLPTVFNMAGAFYLSGAVLLGTLMFVLAFPMGHISNLKAAKRLFRMSLIYLPLLLLFLLIDLGILS